MTTTFNIHLDPGEETFVIWWADTADVPGLTLVADSLSELRRLIDEAVPLHLPAGREIAYLLASDEPEQVPGAVTEVVPAAGAEAAAIAIAERTIGVAVRAKFVTAQPVAA